MRADVARPPKSQNSLGPYVPHPLWPVTVSFGRGSRAPTTLSFRAPGHWNRGNSHSRVMTIRPLLDPVLGVQAIKHPPESVYSLPVLWLKQALIPEVQAFVGTPITTSFTKHNASDRICVMTGMDLKP